MHTKKYFLALWLFAFLLAYTDLQAQHSPDETTGEINYSKEAIHPLQRSEIFPGNNSVVSQNPPPFIWPAVYEDNVEFRNISGAIYPTKKHEVSYQFRLSQHKNFTGKVFTSKDKEWAFYNNYNKLNPGKWYWQYAWSIKGSPYEWSEVFSFEISSKARVYETPSFEVLYELLPNTHPRILTTAKKQAAIYQLYDVKKNDLKFEISKANKALKLAIPKELDALPPKKVRENKKLTERGMEVAYREASKTLAKNMSKSIQALAKSYVLTRDKKYGSAAVEWAMRTASFDPHGPACEAHFADGRHMRNMAWVYDSCYDLLSEKEKNTIANAIKIRLKKYHEEWVNGLENITNSGHVWQQLHFYQIQSAIAIVKDVPEAKEWLAYAYGVFLAKAPALSSPLDGAWANGASYMSANQLSILNTSLILSLATGNDFLKNPWFANNAWYMVHGRPVKAPMSGFGDSHEKYTGIPKEGSIQYMDFLGRYAGIEHANWYVTQAKKFAASKAKYNLLGFVEADPLLDWYFITLEVQEAKKLDANYSIPQSRAFRDVGIVSMHSDIMNPKNDNIIHFRSSPFGSVSNHAHSANNAFNIAVNGERVFFPVGYRNLTNYASTDTHNSILIDGKGQVRGGVGYGWIARYIAGDKISYAVGDASNAYSGKVNPLQKMYDANLPDEIDSGLERFRRHIAMIKPGIFIVYDELEADHAVEWTWLLQSNKKMLAKNNSVSVGLKDSKTKATVFSSAKSKSEVKIMSPVITEDYKAAMRRKKLAIPQDQYTFELKNSEKKDKIRVLTIIQVAKNNANFTKITQLSEGEFNVDGWKIKAELDPNKQADLLILAADKKSGLSTGYSELYIDGKKIERTKKGSSLLVEATTKKERVDKFPQAAR